MSKLTHEEWEKAAGEAQMRLNNLLAARQKRVGEWSQAYEDIRDLSKQIIETEGLLARLQWQRPRGKK